MAVSTYELKKGMSDVKKWDDEHIFYNPLILLNKKGETIKETKYLCKNGIYKLGQLLEETAKESRKLPYDKILVTLAKNVILDTSISKKDTVLLGNKNKVEMAIITQKDLYEDAILKSTTDHTI